MNIVEILVQNGADLDFEFMGMSALHHAAYKSSSDYVKVLLSNGAKVNAQISGGRTPIHLAALESNLEFPFLILKILQHETSISVFRTKKSQTRAV